MLDILDVRRWQRRWLLAAALALLGCGAETHIRLFEPADDSGPGGMDASRPGPGREPDPGPGPQPEAGPGPRDAQTQPSLPDREPSRRDAGRPPPVDAGRDGASEPPGETLEQALVLRYNFTGDGQNPDVVPDLVGDRDAKLIGGATLSPDRDFVRLDGVDDYVDIPNDVVSGLHSATFVAWVTWNGGPCWQRIFDFGISNKGEGEVGNVVTSLFLTPLSCGDRDRSYPTAMLAMAEIGSMQQSVVAEEALPTNRPMQVALVVDGDRRTFTLYRDEQLVGDVDVDFQLGQLTDDNNWLGRSQWIQDAYFAGSYGEFRIYSRALNADEIAQVYAEGFTTP